MQDRARDIVTALYETYTDDPARISEEFATRVAAGAPLHRGVADYIAGMTDRFAITCLERLQG